MINICGRDIKITGRIVRIARLDAERYRFLDDPEPALAKLQNCGARVDLFTFLQRLPNTAPKYEYPVEWDNLAVLPVSTFQRWWQQQIDNKTRNMVRRAEKKQLEVREVPFTPELVNGIWQIYNESPVRQGRRFAHYGKDLATVANEERTFLNDSIFIGAYFEGILVGFVKLLMDESGTQAGLLNIISMIQHRDKAPNNALIAQAVRSCAERRIPYLVYSRFCTGRKQSDSFVDFKRNNGFKQVDLPRYNVPLTALGALGLRLGLHRRIVERVPDPVIAKLRQLRSAWYYRKLQRRPEVSS